MKLTKLLAVKNDCYKAGRKITVKGLMLHSTGANNPKLSRYVGPDDGVLGPNKNNNHWNNPGIEKCVHGFIGKDKNGDIRTYQILDWNHRGWHAGGKANDTHIGVEICEDDLTDGVYFAAVYKEAVELYAYLCKMFGLTERNIIDHSEGHKLGIASNHGDVKHWFSRHGKTMDMFRADVKKLLNGGSVNVESSTPKPAPKPTPKPSVNIDQLARDTINGKYGSGETRKRLLGSNYSAVQKRVNEILSGKAQPAKRAKTVSELADEVIKGLHGSGEQRRKSLGSMYGPVQHEVNKRLRR